MNASDALQIILAVAGLVVTYIFVPWTKEQRDRLRAKRAMNVWLYGKRGVKGISDDIQSAPEQVVEMKHDIKTMKSDIQRLLTAVGSLVDIARSTDQTVRKVDQKVTPNGQDTNSLGDTVARMAKSSGDWLENPKED